ncbi:hypothetical protein RJT34_05033 [Clitoria ternatea]|uniref:Uncharacterized protein n=1 Tax=Clitoria ternatea TaxID=43366 RepID=A0AAN9PST8_CLITE
MTRGKEQETTTTTSGIRKKGTSIRAWLLLDETGETQVVEAGKHAITLLGRESDIVISLEHIKAIVTVHAVLLLNSRDPSVTPFVQELQARITRHHHATSSSKQ